MSAVRGAAMALVVAACAGSAFLAHRAMSHAGSPGAGMLVGLVPLAILFVAVARRTGRIVALLLAAAVALAAWLGWGRIETHFAELFFLEHAGMMLALAILFGRTLARGAEPLCTRFARLVHGSLEPRVVAYTRRLTIVWTAFFASIFLASCVLYSMHLMEAWSLLASVLTPLLVALFFAVEYLVRRRALPDHDHVGFLASVHAFRRHVAGPQAPR